MPAASHHRKVLVLNDEPSIRNLLTLVKELERGNAVDANGETLLAAISRRHFDAVVLDLRCPKRRLGGEIRGIREFRPSRVGTMLVINAEVNGPKSLDMVERYLISGLPHSLLWLVSHRYESPQ